MPNHLEDSIPSSKHSLTNLIVWGLEFHRRSVVLASWWLFPLVSISIEEQGHASRELGVRIRWHYADMLSLYYVSLADSVCSHSPSDSKPRIGDGLVRPKEIQKTEIKTGLLGELNVQGVQEQLTGQSIRRQDLSAATSPSNYRWPFSSLNGQRFQGD